MIVGLLQFLVFIIILGLLYWVIQSLPIPEPVKRAAIVILIIFALIYLIGLIGVLGDHVPWRWPRR